MLTILCADDDQYLIKLLRYALEREGFKALSAHTGSETLRVLRATRVDLVLLGTTMPDLSGRQVLDRLRSFSQVPVIMLAARVQEQEEDENASFQRDADDYVVKPFNMQVLMMRIAAILRRTAGLAEAPPSHVMVYSSDDFAFDLKSRTIVIRGRCIRITRTESQILHLLFRYRGHVLSEEQILERIHGIYGKGSVSAIKTHVSNLRRKMKRLSEGIELICTIRGRGYMLRWGDEGD